MGKESARGRRATMGARGAMPWLMALLAFQASLSAPIQEVAGAADMGDELAGLPDEALLEESERQQAYSSGYSSGGNLGKPFASDAIAPAGAKMPYDQHLQANKGAWAAIGGWSAAQDKQIPIAEAALKKAEKYVSTKLKEKEYSELGCPCEGDKYWKIVQDNPGQLAKAFSYVPPPKKPKYAPGSAAAKKAAEDAVHGSYTTYIKMLRKYGQPGPNSAWTPRHEGDLKRAKNHYKAAVKLEDEALNVALPEFKKVKEDYPEMFTNGKCGCPTGFTFGDAAALAGKQKDDAVAAADAFNRKVRKAKEDPTHWEEPPALKNPNDAFKPSTEDIEGKAKPAAAPAADNEAAKPAAKPDAAPAWWE